MGAEHVEHTLGVMRLAMSVVASGRVWAQGSGAAQSGLADWSSASLSLKLARCTACGSSGSPPHLQTAAPHHLVVMMWLLLVMSATVAYAGGGGGGRTGGASSSSTNWNNSWWG